MKYCYASRTGNVESIIANLGLDALRIEIGNEKLDEDFILFTYTDGYGDVPNEVIEFLANNGTHIKGVVVSGDTSYGDAYCLAGDKISEEYNCPTIYRVENAGSEEDLEAIKQELAKF